MPAVRTGVVLGAVVAAATTGGAQTQESKKVAAPAPADTSSSSSTEDTIATAKREFEATKSLRDFDLPSKGSLPRLAVPPMNPGASPSLPGMKASTPEGDKRQSNWLVEAMTKQPPGRTGRVGEARSPDQQGDDRQEAREDETKAGTESDRKEPHGSINPFARFLGDWMTQQDYALLKPGLERSISSTTFGPNNPVAGAVGENFGIGQVAGLESLAGLDARSKPFGGNPTVRENPYLEALTGAGPSPLAGVGGAARPVPSERPPPGPSLSHSPLEFQTPSPSPKSKIPEFVRPTADEKNFKQLKRF